MKVVGIVIAIIVLSLLILIHEFGHFIVARSCGVLVREFSLGLGPTIVGFGKGETRYSLKAFPFGGACMMEGEDEESESPRAFNNQNVWKRIAIVAAGPVFNLAVAFVCSVIIIAWFGSAEPVVYDVMESYPAEEAGIEAGDRIIKLNNRKIGLFNEIGTYVQYHCDESIRVEYERDGTKYEAVITPVEDEDGYYYLGVTGGLREKGGVLRTLKNSIYEMRYWIWATYEGLGELIRGHVSISDMSGPVGIVTYIDETYQTSRSDGIKYVVANMINICIMLSANLGIMNLLPLPALDGGRLVFLLFEALTRKRVSQDVEGKIHFVGLVLLMALMVVIMFYDIRRIVL